MSANLPRTLFLARRSYRQRRLRDILRVLPLVALILWLIPLLWKNAEPEGTQTSMVGLYVFMLWVLLILGAAVLAARFRPDEDGEDRAKD